MLAGFCDPSSNPFVSVHHCSESRQHWGSSAGHLVMVELGESDGGKAILTGWRHWNPQIPHGYYCPPCRTAQDNRNLEDLLRMQVRGCLSESGLYFLNCIFPKLEIVHLVFPKWKRSNVCMFQHMFFFSQHPSCLHVLAAGIQHTIHCVDHMPQLSFNWWLPIAVTRSFSYAPEHPLEMQENHDETVMKFQVYSTTIHRPHPIIVLHHFKEDARRSWNGDGSGLFHIHRPHPIISPFHFSWMNICHIDMNKTMTSFLFLTIGWIKPQSYFIY